MNQKIIRSYKPDSYVHSIYDINYFKLSSNGIRYAVFDIDCTILPFDDINVTEENKFLFKYIHNLGIKSGLCSSALESRVKPVADALKINYISGAHKPFVNFNEISKMFDDKCKYYNTVYIGDSLYLDMVLAARCNMYKILVDMIRDGNSFKLYPNDLIQAVMYRRLEKYDFHNKQYYRGYLER